VKPFRPANPPPTGGPGTVTRNLLGRAAGAVGEFEWRPRPEAAEASSSDGAASAKAAAEAAAAQVPVPFKRVSVPHKGPMATFNQFPGRAAGSSSCASKGASTSCRAYRATAGRPAVTQAAFISSCTALSLLLAQQQVQHAVGLSAATACHNAHVRSSNWPLPTCLPAAVCWCRVPT
jgi:hypothetical protein